MDEWEMDMETTCLDLGEIVGALGHGEDVPQSDEEESNTPSPEAVTIQINDLSVKFPGIPSHGQIEIMDNVTNTLKRGLNTMIECPDDEERRMGMIVGVLAMQNQEVPVRMTPPTNSIPSNNVGNPEDVNGSNLQSSTPHPPRKVAALQAKHRRKVYVATGCPRETDEMIWTLKQLQNTGYLDNLTLAVLFHPPSNVENIPCVCQHDERVCTPPLSGYDGFKFIEDDGNVHTIEELIIVARRDRFCPMLFGEEIVPTADIIICPQEFITSKFLRTRSGIQFQSNDIIIFDDGKQIEKLCTAELSSATDMFIMKRAARNICNIVVRNQDTPPPPELQEVIGILSDLSQNLTTLTNSLSREWQKAILEQSLLNTLLDAGFQSREEVERLYSGLLRYLDFCDKNNDTLSKNLTLNSVFVAETVKFLTALKYYFAHNGETAAGNCPYYTLRLRKIPPSGNEEAKVTFHIICSKPSIAFQEMSDFTGSIIIGSRCFPSMKILQKQLDPLEQFNNLVQIKTQNVTSTFFAYCGKGPNGGDFEFDHSSKTRQTVHQEVGDAVLELCRVVRNIIFFFPSRGAIGDRIKTWKQRENREKSVWNELEETKYVFNELEFDNPKDASVQLRKFRKLCVTPSGARSGAVLFALHRGSVKEIMDFHDGEIQAIVNIGVPYNSWISFVIEARRWYFDSMEADLTPLTEALRDPATRQFYDWYNAEAFNLLNSLHSHCISRNQKSIAVLTLDQRMLQKEKYFPLLIPNWIQQRLKKFWNFEDMIKSLRNFVQETQNDEDD